MQFIIMGFLVNWFCAFNYQTLKPNQPRKAEEFKYLMGSNFMLNFPRWLIMMLFLNTKRTKLPWSLVSYQLTNYGLLVYALVKRYIFNTLYLEGIPAIARIMGLFFFIYLGIVLIDYGIHQYRIRKHNYKEWLLKDINSNTISHEQEIIHHDNPLHPHRKIPDRRSQRNLGGRGSKRR